MRKRPRPEIEEGEEGKGASYEGHVRWSGLRRREKMFLFWRIDVCVCVVLSPPPPAAFLVVKLSDPMMSLLLPSVGRG